MKLTDVFTEQDIVPRPVTEGIYAGAYQYNQECPWDDHEIQFADNEGHNLVTVYEEPAGTIIIDWPGTTTIRVPNAAAFSKWFEACCEGDNQVEVGGTPIVVFPWK